MDDVLRPVFEVFEAELREQAPRVADALIQSARAHDAPARKALMDEVYRFAHSMKGNAGTLGMEDLEALAHALESLLEPYRSGDASLSAGLSQSILTALDLCPSRVHDALGGFEGQDPNVLRATALLHSLAQASAPTPPASPAPQAPEPRPAERRAHERAAQEMMRVSVERLTRLDRILDDLRDARSALEQRAEDVRRIYWLVEEALADCAAHPPLSLKAARDQLRELSRGLGFEVGELASRTAAADDELRQLRMLPLETITAALPRAVWEHAQREHKQAQVVMGNTQVALDRRILDELKDPLVHLVRNAVDHGLESPEERARLGKPPEGTLRIDVEPGDARVLLTVSDDGRGIDPSRVREAAVRKGLLSPEAAWALDDAGALELLFTPGFSTASTVTLTSGRGVGLDVVRDRVAKVGGRVRVSTEPGKGTRFLLEVPLTLATAQVLLLDTFGQVVGVPLSAVHSAQYVPHPAGPPPKTLNVDGQMLPLDELRALWGERGRDQVKGGFPAVVLKVGERLLAVRVDRILGDRELVLRPLPRQLSRLGHLSSAASTGDGRIVFVLQPRALAERARELDRTGRKAFAPAARRRVLVADDSITTRALHRQVLEAAGFDVETASDGEEAYRLLGASGRGFDLVVSDVRMPRLDGMGLLARIRVDARHREVPVVLISSQDSDEDRLRAEEAGASALLSKAGYERGELLRLLRTLLPA